MRKLFKRLHLWLSLPFGLIILTTCLTGALLVFEQELTQLAFPSRYTVRQVRAEKLPLQTLVDRAAMTLPDSVSITGVTIPSDPKRPYTLGLSKPRKAGLLIDPYTGEIKGRSDRTPFYSVVLLFVLILLSGLGIWWPRRLKGLGARLRIALRHGRYRLLYDLHAVGGMYASLLLLTMALTGLTWSFDWYRSGFYGLFGVTMEQGHGAPAPAKGKPEGHNAQGTPGDKRPEGNAPRGEGRGREGKQKPKVPKTYRHWEQVYRTIASRPIAYSEISLSKEEARASLGTPNTLGNNLASDTYTFDPETGAITEVKLYREAKRDKTIRGWIYTIHVGAWGGFVTRLLAFLAALFGASLPLTGYYLFIKRKLAQRRSRVKRAQS